MPAARLAAPALTPAGQCNILPIGGECPPEETRTAMDHALSVADQQAREFEERLPRIARGLFDASDAVTYSRAPVSVEVVGGLAEFCGGVVLQMPLSHGIFVAVARRDAPGIRLRLEAPGEAGGAVDMAAGPDGITPIASNALDHPAWARRAAACLEILCTRGFLGARPLGVDIVVDSAVPIDSRLAWGSALVVAALQALCGAFRVDLGGGEIARLCHAIETRIADGPARRVDALASAVGRQGSLLVVKCQPDDVLGHQPLPPDWRLVALDVPGDLADEGARRLALRTAAAMALRILQVESRDKWGGYLCNVSPVAWVPWAPRFADAMTGAEFVAQFGGIDNGGAAIDLECAYPIRGAAEYAIRENDRARELIALLQMAAASGDGEVIAEAGSSIGTPRSAGPLWQPLSSEMAGLAALAREFGGDSGIHAMRATCAGTGPLLLVCDGQFGEDAVALMCDQYHHRTGLTPVVLSGSSEGASLFGARTVTLGGAV